MDLYFTVKEPLDLEDIERRVNDAGEYVYVIRDIEYFGNSEING